MKPWRIDVIKEMMRKAPRGSVRVIGGKHEMGFLHVGKVLFEPVKYLLPQRHRDKANIRFYPEVRGAFFRLKAECSGIQLRFYRVSDMARVAPPEQSYPRLKVSDIYPGSADLPHYDKGKLSPSRSPLLIMAAPEPISREPLHCAALLLVAFTPLQQILHAGMIYVDEPFYREYHDLSRSYDL